MKSCHVKNHLTGFVSVPAPVVFPKNFIADVAVLVGVKITPYTNAYFSDKIVIGVKNIIIVKRQHFLIACIFLRYFQRQIFRSDAVKFIRKTEKHKKLRQILVYIICPHCPFRRAGKIVPLYQSTSTGL